MTFLCNLTKNGGRKSGENQTFFNFDMKISKTNQCILYVSRTHFVYMNEYTYNVNKYVYDEYMYGYMIMYSSMMIT